MFTILFYSLKPEFIWFVYFKCLFITQRVFIYYYDPNELQYKTNNNDNSLYCGTLGAVLIEVHGAVVNKTAVIPCM